MLCVHGGSVGGENLPLKIEVEAGRNSFMGEGIKRELYTGWSVSDRDSDAPQNIFVREAIT